MKEHGFFEGDDEFCTQARQSVPPQLYVGVPRSGDQMGDPGYVEVWINEDHPAFFGRILGQDPAWVSTLAVAANGSSGVGNPSANSLVTFDPTSCGAGQINGNGDVNITNLTPDRPGWFRLCELDMRHAGGRQR